MAENDPADLSIFLPRDINIPGSCHEKGRGSYGSVYEVTVHGVKCIAKRIHDALNEEGPENVVSLKFTRECDLLNTLRHPNIVQCLGIYKGPMEDDHHSGDMILMEYMHMDLGQCLSKYHNIILPIKLSVLCDVSHGLLHLHSQSPPIVHRDLTASNILLTPDMRAKIADLGVSRKFDLKDTFALTQVPGTLAYMPPEALTEKPKYDLKLDIFSFGVVALYTCNQKFPTPFEVNPIPIEYFQRNELQLLKRKCWMDELGSAHPLNGLITTCLQDNPDKRPFTSDLCSDVEKLCCEHPWEFENILKSDVTDLVRQTLEKENKVLLSREYSMECKMKEALECIQQKDEQIEGICMDYTAVQKQLEDARQEFETRQCETKKEFMRLQSEKEEQQNLMQRAIDEGRTKLKLSEIELMNTKHECKQILEHYLSKHAAETSELQMENRKMQDHYLELKAEVQALQNKVMELGNENGLLQFQAEVYKADFEEERSSRGSLAGRLLDYEEKEKQKPRSSKWPWFKSHNDSEDSSFS